MTETREAPTPRAWPHRPTTFHTSGPFAICEECRKPWPCPSQQWVDGLVAAVRDLPGVPFYNSRPNEYMCPNCVTPWKCNGPHVPEKRQSAGEWVDRDAVLALLDPEPKP